MTSDAPGRMYGGIAVDDRRRERWQRLLDSAVIEFGTQGYAATPVSAVCRRAGLSSRQFYEHFSGREELLRQLYDQLQREAMDALVAGFAANDLAEVGMAAWIHGGLSAFVEYYDDPNRARVAFVEVVGVSAAFERHRYATRSRWAELLADLARGAVDQQLASMTGHRLAWVAFIGAVNSVIVERTLDPSISADDVLAVMSTLLTDGVLGGSSVA